MRLMTYNGFTVPKLDIEPTSFNIDQIVSIFFYHPGYIKGDHPIDVYKNQESFKAGVILVDGSKIYTNYNRKDFFDQLYNVKLSSI